MSFDNLPPGTPRPGDLLAGRYLIERILGAGGMGVVLGARHVDLGQPVAIKFLNAQFSGNAEIVARFLREARAAAAIKSEHVARVQDITRTEAGVPYIVMEHLEGCDLEQLLRARGPLPIAEVVDYVLQASEAIAEAHAARIVHRDLKPGNLFLTHRADGSALVKVLDFGMSKISDGAVAEASSTAPATMLGSPWYMSPEQVKSSKHVDHRSDVWALGIILHKLISGTQAFEAVSLSSCLVKIVTEPPIPLRARRPDAPWELEAVILRCLEKDVDRRVQNVAELAQALLPFAPERSRVSVERIGRVLGVDVLGEQTIPLPFVAVAPVFAAPHATLPLAAPERTPHGVATEPTPRPLPEPVAPRPPLTSAPVVEVASTSASVASARPAEPRATRKWPIVVAGAVVLVVGFGVVLVHGLGTRPDVGPAASAASPSSPAPVTRPPPAPGPPPTPGPSASATPPAAPSAEPAPTASASTGAPLSATSASRKSSGAPGGILRDNPFGAEPAKPPAAARTAAPSTPKFPGVL